MRCEKCGKLLEEGSFICPECGAKVYSSENEAAKSQPYADPDAQARFMSYMEQNQPAVQADPWESKPKKKKGPIIAIVAAVLVVALGVGGVFAYPFCCATGIRKLCTETGGQSVAERYGNFEKCLGQ